MTNPQSKLRLLWRGADGQALIEYALILVLVAMALLAALLATGPAIANVFSNTVCNLVGLENCNPDSLADRGGGPESFWETVTAVALNPPKEEPIPTNRPFPTKPIPTDGPSPTPTPETPTATFPPTATDKPTNTPQDFGHSIPFIDPIDRPEWWRVDSSIFLGGEDWWGEYYPNKDLSGAADDQMWNYQLTPDKIHKFNINFDWGAGGPISGWLTDNFSVRWTRTIYVSGTEDITLTATITSIGGVRFWVDSDLKLNDWSNRTFNSTPLVATFTLTPGTHQFKLEYYVGTGNAAVFLDINQYKGNVRDDANLASGTPNCQWTRINGSQPNTVAWAWKESPGGTGSGFPANMRCNLELRGYVFLDTAKQSTPKMAFWDVWDLGGGGSVTLQIAEYAPYVYLPDGTVDPSSGPNWATGTSILLRNGGRNYAWTRNFVDIPASYYNKNISYRFVLQSGGGSGTRRWYLDDIAILNMPTRDFSVCTGSLASCGNYWHLDNDGQKGDFITSGRWALTTTNRQGSTGSAWDSSGGSSYVRFGPEQPSGQADDNRIYSIEFNGQVVFQNIDENGLGGIPDWEGNDGTPLLRFYHAYDIESGTSLEIQYTRDPVGTTPANWQTVRSLVSGAATDLSMKQVEIDLSTIPNWWQSPFRLRFAMKVNNSRTPTKPGWWIDSIVFARKGVARFSEYPFCDGAETGMDNWLTAGGWENSAQPGVFGSPRAFTDSPLGNYPHGQETWIELRYPIDFNNDTPENLTVWGGNKNCLNKNPSGAAVRPILTFWHWRDLAANESFYVDVMRPAHTDSGTARINWTPVWAYTYNSVNRTQLAWERVEIDMERGILEAIRTSTGVTMDWNTLKTNGNPYDDDFYFRIRLDARSNTATADGIYIDNIDLGNYYEFSHRLWDLSKGGDGARLVDNIDTPAEWWTRWRNGGAWSTTNSDNWQIPDPPMPYWWKARSGFAAFHDSPPPTTSDPYDTYYRHATFSVLEMARIIDLTGALASDQPTLYFWNHYSVGSRDKIRVEVAVEDPSRTRTGYEYIYGWGSDKSYASPNYSSWQDIWSKGEFARVDTWVREQVDLSEFAGKRIRLRFVMNALEGSSSLRDGWYIDDVRIEHKSTRIMPFPFFDAAANTQNWITEGLWGLAPDLWKGSGGGPANLGPDTWKGYFMKCTNTSGTVVSCSVNSSPSNANNFLNRLTPTVAAMNAYVAANPTKALPMYESNDIIFDFGTTGRPPGAPLGAAGSDWDNQYVGRWIRQISVLSGEYLFATTSDDGVRMRYEPADTPDITPPYDWNILNYWKDTSRTVQYKVVTLNEGSYNVVLEWYEASGDAAIILQAGNNNFSFSDSPRANLLSDAVPSVAYGNSSLLLDGVLNLNRPSGLPSSLWLPKLSYYTYWQLGSSNSANVEVSIDGGLSWTQSNLSNNCPSGATCSPTITGWSDRLPPNDWQWRVHDLRTYGNRPGTSNFIGLRFRLNTGSSIRDGWWITEISVNN